MRYWENSIEKSKTFAAAGEFEKSFCPVDRRVDGRDKETRRLCESGRLEHLKPKSLPAFYQCSFDWDN